MPLSPVDPEAPLRLRDDEATLEDSPRRRVVKKKLAARVARIGDGQRLLYADGRHAVLVVLEGRDASGKDGALRRVFSRCNPQGCSVTSFRAPSEIELRHDFLWRVHRVTPARGMIGLFNRSHYEDVLVARVRGLVPRDVWQARYDQINDFEHMLVQNRCTVLKFFLHVSRGEQRRRLLRRIEKPNRNWKFREDDIVERRLWDHYTDAYRDMLRRCSTDEAPWYLIPADDKKVRDYLISGVVARALRKLDLSYPDADPNVLLAAEQALDA